MFAGSVTFGTATVLGDGKSRGLVVAGVGVMFDARGEGGISAGTSINPDSLLSPLLRHQRSPAPNKTVTPINVAVIGFFFAASVISGTQELVGVGGSAAGVGSTTEAWGNGTGMGEAPTGGGGKFFHPLVLSNFVGITKSQFRHYYYLAHCIEIDQFRQWVKLPIIVLWALLY
jgi:hypothetical protein